MSSMPERDAPGQWGTQQSARPGEWGAPPQAAMPGQEQFGSTSGSNPGQPQDLPGDRPGGQQGQWASQPGSKSPVSELETRVTGRRVVQYLIDAFLVSLIPSLVSIPFDRSTRTSMHIIGGVVFFALFLLIGLWYWVIRPHGHNGQTFGMKLLGLRVISKDGGPANMTQLFIRWVCLIFDALPYSWPFTGLIGFIVILCSRHRQRIGDHLGRTLVIGTGAGVGGRGGQYGRGRASEADMSAANMGQAGTMGQAGPMEQRPMEQRPMEQRPMEQRPMEQRPMEQAPMEQRPMGQGGTGTGQDAGGFR